MTATIVLPSVLCSLWAVVILTITLWPVRDPRPTCPRCKQPRDGWHLEMGGGLCLGCTAAGVAFTEPIPVLKPGAVLEERTPGGTR